VAAALALGACGGSGSDSDSGAGKGIGSDAGKGVGGPRYPYGAATVRAFVDSCAKNGSRSVCQCTIDRLQQTLPFKDFSAADQAIRQDKPLSTHTRGVIDEATEACRQ
jgi:hypothetical protein